MKKTTLFKRPERHIHRLLHLAAIGACFLAGLPGRSDAAEAPPVSAILQEMRSFRELGSVLFIAAHPDDENTQLITYLARGRGYRTAYLSVTRGDGGQNVLGPEFDAELGVIRTQELLAARHLDGGRQFFTRAIDFGYSKDVNETLGIWDRQQVLSDVVRVMRTFRPDVVIVRFNPDTGGTHGHHTASAVLGREAFKLAGDPKAFPEQLDRLTVWQPKRVLLNSGGFGRGGSGGNTANAVQIDIGGNDPLTGESFSSIAGRSRAMHKTQGFGNFGGGGRGGGAGSRPESFTLLGGEPATKDIMDGVATTWARFPGGAEIGKLVDEAIEKFNPANPAASVPALLTIRNRLATLPADRVVDEKRRQFDHILQTCLGLKVETSIPQAEVVPGETFKLRHTASVQSSVPVRWLAVRYPSLKRELGSAIVLRTNTPAIRDTTQTLPASTPLSQPYWLREDGTTGMFRVDDPSLIGCPENPPVFPIEQVFEVGGQTLVIPDEPLPPPPDPAKNEIRRRLDVIAPVSLKFVSEVSLFAPGTTRPVEVEIVAARAGTAGTLRLDAPAGWKVAPAQQSFRLAKVGDHARFTFTTTAPAQPASARITARAQIGGVTFDNQRVEIRYNHIPLQLLQPPARFKAVSLDLAIRGHEVGYLPGAGDTVEENLKQMGYTVTSLTSADLVPERLKKFDAVVVGIRAFDTRKDLGSQMPALFAYVEGGGNVVMQYNRVDGLLSTPLTLRVSQSRVTDENAAVTFLAPDHPALNTPNKITNADFEGWVQERGVYFPSQWDERFTPILACSDAGEAPLKSGLLVAQYGKGYFVYTGLAFFRQLPAGVPGAYRLFANLVSLGK